MTLFKNRLPSVCAVAFAVAVSFAAATPAGAQQDVRPLVERMERLERDVNTLQRQVYQGGPARVVPGQPQGQAAVDMPGDVAGRLQVRMSELERLVQELTGRVEEAQFQSRQAQERLEQFMKDVDFRLNEIEGKGPGAMAAAGAAADPAAATSAGQPDLPAATPAGAGTGQGVLGVMPTGPGGAAQPARPAQAAATPLPGGSPKEQYDYAFALLRKGDYAAAEQALAAFLRAHPQDDLAGNAQYWLGETHYVRGDLEKAAVSFLDGYRTYPKNSKAADNLLKLGITMGRLDKKAEACAALQRMLAEYPQAPDVLKRRAAAERDQLACK